MKSLTKFFQYMAICVAAINLGNPVLACSFAGAERFKPTLESWEEHPGLGQKGGQGPYWEPVPAPIVQVLKVTRGQSSSDSKCSDAGTITLKISLPEESTYNIQEFAIYFRLLKGESPDEIFPDVPMVGTMKDSSMEMLLAWLDGHPSKHKPLDLVIEAFLMTDSLNIGASTIFKIESK